MQQFVRQFYAQLDKQALIMDDRWNGGGFIAPFAARTPAAHAGRRGHQPRGRRRNRSAASDRTGRKSRLLNHWSASDGDIFPYLFPHYGLGKLIGTRSWGGVRGIRGDWQLMDGGYITVPEDAMYTLDSRWAVENHGVDPDVEVENMPADLLAGHDAQLEAAIDPMDKLKQHPGGLPLPPPHLPAYPPDGQVPPASN